MIIAMVQKASGGTLTIAQAAHTWDRTILPYGKNIGLLTGYVKPQEGSSKRTAAGDPVLQKKYYDTVSNSLREIETVAMDALQDANLVKKMMPFLVWNLDEESLQATGKNYRIVGSKERRKHDNQHASSRFVSSLCWQMH